MKRSLLFLLVLVFFTGCQKESSNPAVIKGIMPSSVKYSGLLTISGSDLDNITSDTIFITDNIHVYRLVPVSIHKDVIEVEVYNHESPQDLLQLNFFYVGIKNSEKIEWFDKKVTIVSGWTRLTDFPSTGRYKAGCFVVNGKIYISCGAVYGAVLKDLWKYDPDSGTWTRMADFPGTAREYPVSLSGSNAGYVGCGQSADNSTRVQLYDMFRYFPETNSWTPVTSYPDNISSFFVGYSASVKGRTFAGLSNTSSVMREMVNNDWSSRAGVTDLMKNTGTASFVIGDCFYVVAGFNTDGTSSREVWEYNTLSDSWSKKSAFPGLTRHVAVSFSVGNYGYYGCGRGWNANDQYRDMWRYDPANDKWIRIEDFPGVNRSHTVSASDGTYGYAGLGILMPSSYLFDFWRYDPK